GDVTTTQGSLVTTVEKINGAALGTTTATAGNILVGDGSAWQTRAMSGDVTIDSSGVSAIGANKVTDGMLRQSAARSVIGRSGPSTGNVADISAGVNHNILRRLDL